MLFSLTVNYFFGLWIEKDRSDRKRSKVWLVLITALDLGMLAVFKYTGFICGILSDLLPAFPAVPEIPLPIGISFYTFQILSYVVDVYRGKVPAQKSYLSLGVYLTAFPQLIAGPIVRYTDIEAELRDRHPDLRDAAAGSRRFIVGLTKKVLISNQTALVADSLFAASPDKLGCVGAFTAMLVYAIQIYFDFSGYSDMAIGMGRMIGFHYPENFRDPYTAVSITDFWRRWHISLSSFFRDYVYIPLGGSRVKLPRWVLNMMIVWTLTGLWHGASWNFAAWGFYFGILLSLEKTVFPKFAGKCPALSRIFTTVVVLMGWILFRADTLRNAWEMYRALFGVYGFVGENFARTLQFSGATGFFWMALLVGICLSLIRTEGRKVRLDEGNLLRDAGLILLLLCCMISLAVQSYNPFIYFRF